MTKADLVSEITEKTGIEKIAVQATVESLMTTIIDAMETGENVYLRGFGSFVVKKELKNWKRYFKKYNNHYSRTFCSNIQACKNFC